MNTNLNKIGFINYNNASSFKSNAIKNNTKYQDYTKNTVNYSADNLRANYLVSFKGGVSHEVSLTSNIGTINHETHFFREPKTDEIVQNYVLSKFSNEPAVNVVSGACSTGEEAKSYAMMLDSLGNKLQIFGFDISDDVIRQTVDSTAHLLVDSDLSCLGAYGFDSEKFLTDDYDLTLSPYLQQCKEKFRTYYTKSGESKKLPVNPDAQKQLDDLNEILNDKEKYSQAEQEFNKKINEQKEKIASGEIEDELGMLDFLPSFRQMMEMTKRALEEQCKLFYTFQDYEAEEGIFNNCSFKQGDVLRLEELYAPNSINALLYRNALYHTLCHGDNLMRFMKDDAQETMDYIANQMNKVVKKDGLVVFGEREFVQGVDKEIVGKSMEKNGFKKLVQSGEQLDNVWVKVEDIG